MSKTVLLLIENGHRDEEVIYPYYRFIEAGFNVEVVGPEKNKEYKGKFGLVLKSTLALEDVNIDEIEAVIIPGGYAPDLMRLNKPMVKIVKDAFNSSKIIASICHAAHMLVEADIIKGKNVTCWASLATDLINAGGNYLDQEVVVDGNLVCSRMPDDLPAFCKATIDLIK
ncbi:MAG: type 1 glutamine amidotransferase domain-containing protein [Bacteroidota bacterium]